MMTTAETLEAITDRAKFEILSSSVLRRANRQYASIVQTGINAKGETIVAPLDGLHLIPQSMPPHYVFVQHTTTDRKGLRGKWLSDKDSDLNKSIEEAQTIRREVSNAIFTVVLSTNQRVDVELVKDVTTVAIKNGLSIDTWTQDRFTDFLDNDKDGQWLRKKHLGIEAERISHQLLLELCRKSLEEYNQFVNFENSVKHVRRSETDDIKKAAAKAETSLLLVAGDSGRGKSTLVALAMRELIQDGMLAIWLPPRFLSIGIPLYSALGNWLRTLAPNIEMNAGQEALLIAESSGGILVCVDDINRVEDSASLLRNITALSTPQANKTAGGETWYQSLAATIAVPVWPSLLQYMEKNRSGKPWIRTVSLGELKSDESVEVIISSAPQLTELEARGFADRLGNDPFLVGNFSSLIDSSTPRKDMALACRDVVTYVLSQMENRIAHASNGQLLSPEIRSSCMRFGHAMLANFCLTPTWDQIETWFANNPRDLQAIRRILADKEVCRLASDNRVVFRHDRFRDYMLAESSMTALKANNEEIVSDPFFAKFIGQAIAANEDSAPNLESLRRSNPMALFEAIRFIGEPTNNHQKRILGEIERWCIETPKESIDSLVDAISFTLLETDSSAVKDLVERFHINWVTLLAGFRNGDLKCGIRYFKSHSKHSFEPGIGNQRRDQIVRHVKNRFLLQLQVQILDLEIAELSEDDAAGLLALIGHVSPKGMDAVISSLWKKDAASLLPYAIWAACRCPLNEPGQTLGPMLEHLRSLPVRTDYARSQTHREQFVQYLSWAFQRGINTAAVKFLLDQEFVDDEFRRSIVRLVDRVDHPEAIEFLVRGLADGCGSNKWSHLGLIGDNPPLREPLSRESADRLRRIWSSTDEEANVRNNAFCLWLIVAPEVRIEELQNISPDEPFSDYSLQFRVLSRDFTAADALIKKISDNEWWWVLSHHIWEELLEAELDKRLGELKSAIPADFSGGSSNIEYSLQHVLVMIPPKNGEVLLAKHWDHLKFSKKMFEAALRIGTPTCVNLAKESVALNPQTTEMFDYMFMDWHRAHPSNPITTGMLSQILQFSDMLTTEHWQQLVMAIEWSKDESGELVQWVRNNIFPLIPESDRANIRYSDENLIREFDRNLDPKWSIHLYHLFDNPRSGPEFVPRILRVVREWFEFNRTQRGLEVIAACLAIAGTRTDLKMLDAEVIGDPDEIERIRHNARFSVFRRTLI